MRELSKALERERSMRAAAEAAEARASALLEMAPDGVVIVDAGGVINYVNGQTEKMFGHKRGDLLGKPVEVLIPERYRGKHIGHREGYVAEPRTRPMGIGLELYGLRSDGTEFPVEIALSPLHTEQGLIVIAIIRDVTERRHVESEIKRLNDDLNRRATELEAANKELEAFSYSVSHDLRAPLRAIDGFSQALAEDYSDKLDEHGKDYLRRVRAATQRMGDLIDDLLMLSRLTRSEMSRDRVDLSALAEEVISGLRQTTPERRVDVSIQPGMVVEADPHLLRIALDNLLGNAWKFTGKRDDARIEVGAARHDDETAYYVRDNGAGFDMAHADNLFAPFQRLHRTEEFSGTGIGLAMVQRIIRRHGGRIWAESAVGEGATFYFTL